MRVCVCIYIYINNSLKKAPLDKLCFQVANSSQKISSEKMYLNYWKKIMHSFDTESFFETYGWR